MMELFFNALWFVVSAGAIIALLRRRHGLCKRKQFLRLASVLCAAAILFPSISISDDIHVETFVVEDSSPAKRLTHAIAHATPVALAFWFVSAVLLLVFVVPNQRSWLVVDRGPSFFQPLLFIHDRMGRAPPPHYE